MPNAYLDRQRLALLTLDVLAFSLAFALAMHLRFSGNPGWFVPGSPPWEPMLASLPVMLGGWMFVLWSCGLYRRQKLFYEFARLVQAILILSGGLLSVVFFYRGFSYSRGFAGLFLIALVVATFAGRVAFRIVRTRIDRLDADRNRVLLVGNSSAGNRLIEAAASGESPLHIVGVIDDNFSVGEAHPMGSTVLADRTDLAKIASEHQVRSVILVDDQLDAEVQLELVETCLGANLEWRVVPNAYQLMLDRVEVDAVAGIPLLSLKRSNIRGSARLVKRAFDLVAAFLLMVLLWPLMFAVALAIKLSSKGPVFFTQMRMGENGKLFRFYKFRSMHTDNDDSIHREYTRQLITDDLPHTEDDDGEIYKIKNDPRLIPIGAFIRKYSIDELPQLFNVILGDMSLIGPRPPVPYEVEVYRQWHKRRFEGPAGITGLWQVSGRNRLTFDEMVKLDIEYLENWSFSRDLKILWRTMGVVLFDRAY